MDRKKARLILKNHLDWMKNNNDSRVELEEAIETVLDEPKEVYTIFQELLKSSYQIKTNSGPIVNCVSTQKIVRLFECYQTIYNI